MSFLSDLFSGDKAKFTRDVNQLAVILRTLKKDWVPINEDEIESIAYNISFGRKKRVGFTSYVIGEISTIFHEVIGSVGLRSYGKGKGMLAIQSNPYLYTYLIRPKFTEVQINGNRFAYILANGTIKNSSGRKVIGQIDYTDVNNPEIVIGDNNFGILNAHSSRKGPQDRALQFMKAMPEGVQELFVAVLFLHIVSKQSSLTPFSDK